MLRSNKFKSFNFKDLRSPLYHYMTFPLSGEIARFLYFQKNSITPTNPNLHIKTAAASHRPTHHDINFLVGCDACDTPLNLHKILWFCTICLCVRRGAVSAPVDLRCFFGTGNPSPTTDILKLCISPSLPLEGKGDRFSGG